MLIGGRRWDRAASAVAETSAAHADAAASAAQHRSVRFQRRSTRSSDAASSPISRSASRRPSSSSRRSIVWTTTASRCRSSARLTRRAMAAAAVLVVLLLAGTFYATRQLSAPPAMHDPVAVLIADFQNTTNDPAFDDTLDQALRRALESASFITAFDRTRVRATFGVAAPEQLRRSRGASARDQTGSRRGPGRVDRAERQRLRHHGQRDPADDRRR